MLILCLIEFFAFPTIEFASKHNIFFNSSSDFCYALSVSFFETLVFISLSLFILYITFLCLSEKNCSFLTYFMWTAIERLHKIITLLRNIFLVLFFFTNFRINLTFVSLFMYFHCTNFVFLNSSLFCLSHLDLLMRFFLVFGEIRKSKVKLKIENERMLNGFAAAKITWIKRLLSSVFKIKSAFILFLKKTVYSRVFLKRTRLFRRIVATYGNWKRLITQKEE